MRPRHLAILSLLAAPPLCAQNTKPSQKPAPHAPTSNQALVSQPWQTNCTTANCILSLNVLRGESGDPTNVNNPNDYISIAIGINLQDNSPAMLIVQVTPKAQADRGVTLTFTRAATHHKHPGSEPDHLVDPIPLPFQRCDEATCTVIAPNAQATNDGHTIDLLARFLTAPQLTLLYVSNKHEYKTTIPLPQFRKDYAKILHENAATSTTPTK